VCGANAGHTGGGRTESAHGIAKIDLIGHGKTLACLDGCAKRNRGQKHNGCCPRGGGKQREKQRLRVVMMVMMMVVVMMMGPSGERRTCKHHQEQHCRK
jgi:hypothetical protein